MDEKVVYRAIGSLHLLEKNPRRIGEREFQQLCQSIAGNPDFFHARPILLSNRTGKLVIIAGNMRYRAAIHLGFKQVPTYLFKGLSEDKEREIIIRDNVNNGSWDWDILANEFDAKELASFGVDLPPMRDEDEESGNTSPVGAKLQHTCPKCGHTWTKAND